MSKILPVFKYKKTFIRAGRVEAAGHVTAADPVNVTDNVEAAVFVDAALNEVIGRGHGKGGGAGH